jgi:hypothetical protein
MGYYPNNICNSIAVGAGQLQRAGGEFCPGRRPRRGKNFAQEQMRGKKGGKPKHGHPQDDIKILIDPMLWLLVVESVNVINVDGDIGIRRVRSGRQGTKVAHQRQTCGQDGPGKQCPPVIAKPVQEPDQQQRQPAMKQRKAAGE